MARLLILLVIALTSAAATGAEGSLEEVKKKFISITSFKASFSQTTAPAIGDTQYFEGAINLSRPAKVRMEISTPEEQLIVYNGERAWLYLPEQNICYTYTASRIGNLAQMPEYIFDPFEKLTVDTFYTIEKQLFISFIVPEGDPFLERIELTISRESLLPQELLIEDKAGTRIEYAFSGVTINGAEEVSFTFSPPKGTDVIEQ